MYWFNRQRTALLASMKTAPSVEPYLTFQSVNSFTISVASPKWGGTMEYSTDTENWFTWNGSSISSVDGKVYLRGTENTRVSSNSSGTYSSFVISGTAVECVGNIETLLDWNTVLNGEHPTMNSYCFYYAFLDNYALIAAPKLPATTLAEGCYYNMFSGCTNLKVSATQTGAYQHEWRIPTEETISSTPSNWNTGMFASTGGTFKGSPAINTTYYLEYPPVGSEPAIPPVLETPTNISVSGSTLIWDAVANAMSYNVYKDGILFNTVATNSCDISGITEAGSYSFAVQALADGYTPSAISDVIVYEVVSEGLTGTKWQFNDEIDMPETTGWVYYIDATVYNNQHNLTIEYISLPDYWDLHLKNTYQPYEFYYDSYWEWYSGSGWPSETDAPIIEITGGDDVDNPEFITWLQENATKIS